LSIIFYSISIISIIALIIIHIKVPKLMKHPGNFIIYENIFLLLSSSVNLILLIAHFANKSNECIVTLAFASYFKYMSLGYITALNIEISFKMYYRTHIKHRNRVIMYHILVNCYAIIVSVVNYTTRDVDRLDYVCDNQ
jgi:hypothetical protein